MSHESRSLRERRLEVPWHLESGPEQQWGDSVAICYGTGGGQFCIMYKEDVAGNRALLEHLVDLHNRSLSSEIRPPIEISNGAMAGAKQCYYGSNCMRYVTHEDDEKIPEGLACIYIDNNGWVGTNNGWPHAGQPALFPIAQAEALMYAWGAALGSIPAKIVSPQFVSEEARKWLRWPELETPKEPA